MKLLTRPLYSVATAAAACAIATGVFADDPDGPPEPEFYIYLNMLDDRQNFDCFMEFFQERRLPTGQLCRSIAQNLEQSMREAGLPATEPAIKALERDVLWRIRETLGRMSGKLK